MKELILLKEDVQKFIKLIAEDHTVFLPGKQNGIVEFRPYEEGMELFDRRLTRQSIKQFLLPQREILFHFENNTNKEKSNTPQTPKDLKAKKAIFGVRPCDAKSIHLNSAVFDNNQKNCFKDKHFSQNRDLLLIIGWSCNQPTPTCFCDAVGGDPSGDVNMDLLFTDMGEQIVVKPFTEKGSTICTKLKMQEITAAQQDSYQLFKEASHKVFEEKRNKDFTPFKQDLDTLFNLTLWDELAEQCTNCGICTFLCPTCTCFDILDQKQDQDQAGHRFRIWDSCMFRQFTAHASGHNPREEKKARVRQRFLHKLKYYPDANEDQMGCVGCGKCIQHCPVNIDIREVASKMKSELENSNE